MLLCLLFALTVFAEGSAQREVLYKFTSLDYDWPTASARSTALKKKDFIIENNIITGIKVYKNDVYVTVPRWKLGVPATLNKLVTKDENTTVLQPYPSWNMNGIGNCGAFQYVQSMEIDPNTGYMWIIDTGRINTNAAPEKPHNLCMPKLIIIDIEKKTTVRKFIFPANVTSPVTNFMNDIVLDYVNGKAKYAYITDTSDAKIYVYDYEANIAYFYKHDSMKAHPLVPGVQDGLVSAPVDGIAMSSDFRYLYYSTLSSLQLYAVPTHVMRSKNSDFAKSIIRVGQKKGGSDGMACGHSSLFYAALEENAIYKANQESGIVSAKKQTRILQNDNTAVWIDTFAWNGTFLWFTANSLPSFFAGKMNFTGSDDNMVISKLDVGELGYLDGAKSMTTSNASSLTQSLLRYRLLIAICFICIKIKVKL